MNESKIEWTDITWNPISGCSKVSQGCKNCYAERVFPRPYPGRAFTDVRTHPDRLDQPIHMRNGRRIFVNSMSDLFHEAVPFEFIADVFAVMACTTRHTYQVLTKRPKRMQEFFSWLAEDTVFDWPERIDPLRVWPRWTVATAHRGGYDNCGPVWPLQNVWLGVSVEDQETADERIPLLLKTPAAVRFISAEPLLGPISFEGMFATDTINDGTNALESLDLVIAGGESGPKARPSHPDWFRSLRDQCAKAETAFFFKQWGEWLPHDQPVPQQCHGMKFPGGSAIARNDSKPMLFWRIGKKNAGRLLDEREHSGMPA